MSRLFTRALNKSTRKGVELTMSGYNSGDKASSPLALRKLIPAIAAKVLMLLLDRLLISGAKVTVVEYSLGMLKPTIKASTTAMPHTFNISRRSPQSFCANSIKSISCSADSFGSISCFFSSIRNNDCEILCNRLIYEHNTYRIDYEDLEQKASDPKARILLLCNPHNPAGRVWTINELKRIGEICIRHGIIVISDEIHCELVYPGHRYIPFASISEDFLHQSVTCLSPSKSFNIAGLQIANIISFDENWRKKIDKAININEVCDVNPFGVRATIAAYNKGEEWLQQLISYLKANYGCFKDFCDKNLTDFPIAKLEGTYLVWMDCRKLDIPSEELERQLIKEAKLWLNAGTMYGQDGEGFMRWNIACPRTRMLEGLERFYKFINQSKA